MTTTDAPPNELPEDRAAAHTDTDLVSYPGPTGPILYAEVNEDGHLVGYVWIAQNIDAHPRAGIVLLPSTVIPASVKFQNDLGPVSLNVSQTIDPLDWLTYLEATRDGGYKLAVGSALSASDLNALRHIAGYSG